MTDMTRKPFFPENLKYTSNHMWARKNRPSSIYGTPGTVTIGIDDLVQSVLGEIAFIDLPPLGAWVDAGDEIGVLEAKNAVLDLFSPVSGYIYRLNPALKNTPEIINEDPFGLGWIMELQPDEDDNPGLCDNELWELLTAEQARGLACRIVIENPL